MPDIDCVRIQVSSRCLVCSELTPVNAAVESLNCVDCGAEFTLHEQLWTSVFDDARAQAEELDANATAQLSFDAKGTTLTVALAALDASCPHCEHEWDELPEGRCPHCDNELSRRAVSAGTVVGEDRHMLAGAKGREPDAQTLSCVGCGTPLVSDGSSRTIDCSACSRENVVPDEVWRRVHAPGSVASWWLYFGGERAAGLRGQLRPQDLAGGEGRVYMLGGYADTPWALLALQTDPLGIAWMVDLERAGMQRLTRLVVWADEIFAYAPMTRAVEVFDARSGEHLRRVSAPDVIQDLAPGPDGSLVALGSTNQLSRFDAQGQASELWGKRGLFERIFGGERLENRRRIERPHIERPPKKRIRRLESGRIGVGADGDLRVISRRWIAHFARDGDLRSCAEVPGANIAIVAPAASADGSTFAVLRTVGGTMNIAQIEAMVEAMVMDEGQSSSALVRVGPGGGPVEFLRRSGEDEFTALALTAAGELWVATSEGALLRLDAHGELLWRQPGQS